MTEDEIITKIANRSHTKKNEVRNWARRTGLIYLILALII